MIRSVVLCALALSTTAHADVAHAVRRTTPVSIDGRLDDAAWQGAPRHTGFTQRAPRDGAKASFETTFSVLYDDAAIYVAVWASDPSPAEVRRLLTRRDIESAASDVIAIGIDSSATCSSAPTRAATTSTPRARASPVRA